MQMILWPAVITLALTLLRLTGELQGWSPALFSREAGGGAALIGISWLPFLLGPYFARKLAQSGKAPQKPWQAAGLSLLGMVATFVVFGVVQAMKLGIGFVLLAFLISLATAFIPWKAWPELGRVLLAYALAARAPVLIVMLLAIYGKWGTHYDALPPEPPPALLSMGPLGTWFFIGVLPQMTIWIAQTVLVGTLTGAILLALSRTKAKPA